MGKYSWLKRPPWRTMLLLIAVLAVLACGYGLWSPGKVVTDGRHDLGQNGIWIQHGWLGDDAWFARNKRDKSKFRDTDRIRTLAEIMARHGITDLYPHLCPCLPSGQIAAVDDDQTERFLDEMKSFRVIPWVGGVRDVHAFPGEDKWRKTFVDSVVTLLNKHPRLGGVQINIEPMPTGDRDFLFLLKELKSAMPQGKILSVAAYPPPTRWHKFPEVHWEEDYYRAVAAEVDQMAVMMYDTAIRWSKIYRNLMVSWTEECLDWAGDTAVLLGVPVYDDAGVGYHEPKVENLRNALFGIHGGLAGYKKLPDNYQGIAIYCEWEMDSDEWDYLQQYYLKKHSGLPRARLRDAIRAADFETVRQLVPSVVDANAEVGTGTDPTGDTPLALALWDANNMSPKPGTVQIIRFLIESGADVNKPNKNGRTPLHFPHNVEVIKALLEAGAKVDVPATDDGTTPLYRTDRFEILQLLVPACTNINSVDKKGMTALDYHKQWEYARKDIIAFLRKHGAKTADELRAK